LVLIWLADNFIITRYQEEWQMGYSYLEAKDKVAKYAKKYLVQLKLMMMEILGSLLMTD